MSLSIFLPYHPTYVDLCIPTHSLLILPSYWHSFNQENKENFKLSGGKQMMRNCTAYQDITVKHIRMLQSYISWYYSQTYQDTTAKHIWIPQSNTSRYYSQACQDAALRHIRVLQDASVKHIRGSLYCPAGEGVGGLEGSEIVVYTHFIW